MNNFARRICAYTTESIWKKPIKDYNGRLLPQHFDLTRFRELRDLDIFIRETAFRWECA